MKYIGLDPVTDDYGNIWYPCRPKTKLYCYTIIKTKVNGELRAFWVYKTIDAKRFKNGHASASQEIGGRIPIISEDS